MTWLDTLTRPGPVTFEHSPEPEPTFGETYPHVRSADEAVDLARATNMPVRAWVVFEWDGQDHLTPVKAYPSGCFRYDRVTH